MNSYCIGDFIINYGIWHRLKKCEKCTYCDFCVRNGCIESSKVCLVKDVSKENSCCCKNQHPPLFELVCPICSINKIGACLKCIFCSCNLDQIPDRKYLEKIYCSICSDNPDNVYSYCQLCRKMCSYLKQTYCCKCSIFLKSCYYCGTKIKTGNEYIAELLNNISIRKEFFSEQLLIHRNLSKNDASGCCKYVIDYYNECIREIDEIFFKMKKSYVEKTVDQMIEILISGRI